jgi:hypothetical protein
VKLVIRGRSIAIAGKRKERKTGEEGKGQGIGGKLRT